MKVFNASFIILVTFELVIVLAIEKLCPFHIFTKYIIIS